MENKCKKNILKDLIKLMNGFWEKINKQNKYIDYIRLQADCRKLFSQWNGFIFEILESVTPQL